MDERTPSEAGHVNWSSALFAGLLATVVMTIVMALFGTNIMKMLGSTMLGSDASIAMQYAVGGAFHLMVGLVYAVIYAWLFGQVTSWNRFLKGVVFGLGITAIALATMPVMMAMMGGGGASNPCSAANPCAAVANPCNPCGGADNPCKAKADRAHNPCNPCDASVAAGNPCGREEAENPCTPEAAGAPNPCNPCAANDAKTSDAKNPCGPAKQSGAAKPAGSACGAGTANPYNPCGGGGGTYDGIISLINHLVYALVLAFAYRPRRT